MGVFNDLLTSAKTIDTSEDAEGVDASVRKWLIYYRDRHDFDVQAACQGVNAVFTVPSVTANTGTFTLAGVEVNIDEVPSIPGFTVTGGPVADSDLVLTGEQAPTTTPGISSSLNEFSPSFHAAPITASWRSVVRNDSMYVAVAFSKPVSGGRVMTSSDGETWTHRSSPELEWYSVAWSEDLSLFCAVANSGSGNRAMTSPDGVTWTQRTTPDAGWQEVIWVADLGLFVAVAQSGVNRVMTSPDGINWTGRTVTDNRWRSVTYGDGVLVAVADSGDDRAMVSTDGITWTDFTMPTGDWFNVEYGNGKFVAVKAGGSGPTSAISADGETWTSGEDTAIDSWRSLTFNNGVFLRGSLTNDLSTSVDGSHWVLQPLAIGSQSWLGLAPDGTGFVGVSFTGSDSQRVLKATMDPVTATIEVTTEGKKHRTGMSALHWLGELVGDIPDLGGRGNLVRGNTDRETRPPQTVIDALFRELRYQEDFDLAEDLRRYP